MFDRRHQRVELGHVIVKLVALLQMSQALNLQGRGDSPASFEVEKCVRARAEGLDTVLALFDHGLEVLDCRAEFSDVRGCFLRRVGWELLL